MKTRVLDKRFRLALVILLVSLIGGVVGYRFVEKTTWIDAVYVVVQVFSTVGLDKHHDISPAGRVYLVFLISVFLTGFTVAASLLVRHIGSGEMGRALRHHWREKKAHKMKDHIIICGFGRVGRQLQRELNRAEWDIVIVERDGDVADALAAKGAAVIQGDATEEETLMRAGVENAQGLLAGLPEDADNVFVTLTAKEYNPNIRIVSRADDEKSSSKLLFAGAKRVVMPQEMGGQRMANALMRPVLAEFLEVVTGESPGLWIDEWTVPAKCDMCGQTVSEVRFRTAFGVSVLGIAKAGQGVDVAEVPNAILETGDTLVVLGTAENLRKLGSKLISRRRQKK